MIKKQKTRSHFPYSGKDLKHSKFSQRRDRTNKVFPKTLVGRIKRHPDGFGFFIPEDSKHPDVYLPIKQMSYLMSNDKIKVSVHPRGNRKGLFSGKVVQLIQRFHEQVVGQYHSLSKNTGLIKDESRQWGEDLKVQLPVRQNISNGEWVQVQITHWPGDQEGFCGKVVVSLGKFYGSLEDNIRVIQKNNILSGFTVKGLKEADSCPKIIPHSESHQRKNLKNLPFVTIDGETAKDFDDAIYVCHQKEGGWILYTAIADVSYYVPVQSFLDKEAYSRGNSTYFPDYVVPMLPDSLSQELCSLKPHEDRLVFVVEISFSKDGGQQSTQFYEAVIHSQCRLNYGQAQDIIEEGEFVKQVSKSVRNNVLNASQLAKKLLYQREKNHFVDLNIPETEVCLNKVGDPVDIIQVSRLFSNQMIEELMLITNQAVAWFIYKAKVPSLYRIHDEPKSENLKSLEVFLQSLGLKIRLSGSHLQKKYLIL